MKWARRLVLFLAALFAFGVGIGYTIGSAYQNEWEDCL